MVSLSIGVVGLMLAAQAQIGLRFLLALVPVVIVLILIPLIAYRAYALWRASYTLQREGILLKWGLREEIIPMDVINWVNPSQELEQKLPLPILRWPGAVLGVRHLSDGSKIEYLSAQSRPVLLISTAEQIYAISPENPEEFVLAYQRFAEMGSLTPLAGKTVYPANILRLLWASLPARILVLGGLTASLLLFVYVILSVPSREAISLGYNPDGSPSAKGPAVYLLLLPILNGLVYIAETLLGLYFFRAEEKKSLAYILWVSGLFTSLLFIIAAYLLLEAN